MHCGFPGKSGSRITDRGSSIEDRLKTLKSWAAKCVLGTGIKERGSVNRFIIYYYLLRLTCLLVSRHVTGILCTVRVTWRVCSTSEPPMVYPGTRGDLWRERGAKRGRGKIASGRIRWKSHFHAKPKYRNNWTSMMIGLHTRWNRIFVAVGVFPLEILAYQVSMVCDANWPR